MKYLVKFLRMIDTDLANEFISFYFFALMQKSNKKNQGCKKWLKIVS